MKASVVSKMVAAIEAAGITRFTVITDNHDIQLEVGSESTQCIFDDDNECIWYFRMPNGVQPKDFRPIAFGVIEYDNITIMSVPTDMINAKTVAENAGLELTEEITDWLKKVSSQAGLYPVQSSRKKDKEGNAILYNGIPTCR